MSGRGFISPLLFCCVVNLWISFAEAKTIYVDSHARGDGSSSDWVNACRTITSGLALAVTGDQVWVKSARYKETITLKDGVGLYGGFPAEGSPEFSDRDWRIYETVIDATRLNSSVALAESIEDATIDGFTITGGCGRRGAGIYCSYSSLRVVNCCIRGNRITEGYPGYFLNGGGGVGTHYSSVWLENCVILANISLGQGGGIRSWRGELTAENCLFAGNIADRGGALYFEYASVNVMECTIELNSATSEGAGIACVRSSASVDGCLITKNKVLGSDSTGTGGGLYVWEGNPIILTKCTIADNTVPRLAAGLALALSSAYVNACSFVRNSAKMSGGGVFASRITTDFDHCTFQENSAQYLGGGVAISIDTAAEFTQCLFRLNTASSGGGIYNGGADPMLLANCVFAGNYANGAFYKGGGAVYSGDNSSPAFVNCTFTGNSATTQGGALKIPWISTTPKLLNCILWNNLPGEIEDLSGRTQITWSNVRGGWLGEGNIDATPEFAHPWDGVFGDYHLLPGSPCIDAGSNEAAAEIPLDLDGNVRVWDGDDIPGAIVDMGAYEYGSLPPDHVTPSPTPTLAPTPTPTPIIGDINRDGRLDEMDLFLFSREWQKSQ